MSVDSLAFVAREAVELLRYMTLVETSPCQFDHHGFCQEHPGGFREVDDAVRGERPECWVAAARSVVTRFDRAGG